MKRPKVVPINIADEREREDSAAIDALLGDSRRACERADAVIEEVNKEVQDAIAEARRLTGRTDR